MISQPNVLFLWRLFYLYFVDEKKEEVFKLVSTLYDGSDEIPAKIETLLLDFWSKQDDSKLVATALLTVRNYYFDIERHAALIAILIEKKFLTVNEASQLLYFPGKIFSVLPFAIKDILETNLLIYEDFREGRIKPDEDDMLSVVLHKLYIKIKQTKYLNSE
ncbi:MAG: hypothetical protein JSR33_09165 [Proteobacteria bacterium]|nr:hypothetical protein [Pseudomonadota bacterium]